MRFRSGFYLRLALIADLGVYLIALMLFVILPLFPVEAGERLTGNEFTPVEIVLASVGVIPVILLFGRLVERPRVPLNEWAYIVTGAYGLLVLAVFLSIGVQQVVVERPVQWAVVAMILIGVVGSTGAHVFDGSTHPLGPTTERWLRERE